MRVALRVKSDPMSNSAKLSEEEDFQKLVWNCLMRTNTIDRRQQQEESEM